MRIATLLLALLAAPMAAWSATQSIVITTNPVTQITAGTNVTISPTSGKGNVTINAAGGSTVGLTSTTGAGYYLGSSTIKDGVVIGGVWEAGGGGGDVSKASTQTFSGTNTFSNEIMASSNVNVSGSVKLNSIAAPSAKAGRMWLDSTSGRMNYYDSTNTAIQMDPNYIIYQTTFTGSTGFANNYWDISIGLHGNYSGIFTAEIDANLMIGLVGNFIRMSCKATQAGNIVWTLRKNYAGTSLTCTTVGGGGGTYGCTGTTDVSVAATDFFNIQQTGNNTANTAERNGCVLVFAAGAN